MRIELDISREDIQDLILGLRLLKKEKQDVMKLEGVGLGQIADRLGSLSLLEDRLFQHL